MKFPLNRIRPHLPKWLPLLPQEESAPELKDITAEELQEICKLISPSLSHCLRLLKSPPDASINIPYVRSLLVNAFLYNIWKVGRINSHYNWEDFNTSNLQQAKEKIIELGLSENIKLHFGKHLSTNWADVKEIEIKNLHVKGIFETELNHIDEIKFTNNIFQEHATIRVIGTSECYKCTFRNNKFQAGLSHPTFNVNFIDFTNNKFYHRVDLHFTPPIIKLPSCDGKPHEIENNYNEAVMDITRNFTLTESHLNFTKNKAMNLFLHDHKEIVLPYKSGAIPFKKIEFSGGNIIDYLQIETRNSAVNCSSGTRANVNEIFFDVSDKISPSKKISDDNQKKEHQLSYLEFFSLLKRDAAKQHNPVLEDIYAKKIRYFSRVLVSRWQDKFIFHWGNWISDGGESWTKPLGWFVLFQLILSCIAKLSAWLSEFPVSFGALVFEFLNPLSSLPSLDPDEMPAWVLAFLLLFHKLVAAVTIYEAVKALRRFSK